MELDGDIPFWLPKCESLTHDEFCKLYCMWPCESRVLLLESSQHIDYSLLSHD